MAAINIIAFQYTSYTELFLSWLIASILALLVIEILEFLANMIIFIGVDLRKAVIKDNNIALGLLQGTIYASIGFLLAQLLA